MKRFTSVMFFMLFVVVAFAQQRIPGQNMKLDVDFKPAKNDTLVPASFLTGTPTYYVVIEQGQTADTGFVAGTNYYGDAGAAQQYIFEYPAAVHGAIAWVHIKEGNATGNVIMKVQNSNGQGYNNTGGTTPVNTAPGTVLGSVSKSYTDIEEMDFNIFMFPSSVNVTGPYYISLDWSAIPFPANRFGLVATTDGDAGELDLSWNVYDDNSTWVSLLADWDLDVDLALFPIVTLGTEIQDVFVNNLITNIYPNPARSLTTVEYALSKDNKDVKFYVFDAQGKAVVEQAMGAQQAGNYTVSFDASQLSAGTYFYGIIAGKSNLVKPFVVQ